ncbi:MAG: CRISPR-associated endonuclease Cas2 [Patescibacteria group bacterium]
MSKIKTIDVLKVVAAGGIVVGSAVIPSLPMILLGAIKLWKDVNRTDLGRIIKRLEKQEMIAIRDKDGKTSMEITEKGKRRLLKYDFENIKLKAKKRDGKWRLIIFDIPEEKKQNREAFRSKLVQLGCVRLQDSVFVSAFPCKTEIDFLCHYLQISDYVTMAILDRIERGEKLLFREYHE